MVLRKVEDVLMSTRMLAHQEKPIVVLDHGSRTACHMRCLADFFAVCVLTTLCDSEGPFMLAGLNQMVQ